MLEIKKISKIYETAGFKQKALDGVSLSFRENEFVAILGPSGSGKTTFLNIIGGLDSYTSGDLIINGISTKKYKDSDWDSYRNHRIGFVFQSYNLIGHQTVLSNVRLALTLSGISKNESIKRAKKALKDVGLENHMYKKPNQLSGGQMQRVAIARALVNDPDILLADEPTGALDSETSIQIMESLKKIAEKKLVIMVTHNPDLANEYANRIITLKDGMVTSDSNPYNESKNKNKEIKKDKKTKMSFKTALSLSFNNLMTKKGRTILVSLAGSIGIIGIALILALSTGFQKYIDDIQESTLTSYPLTITEESSDVMGVLLDMRGNHEKTGKNEVEEEQYITNMLSSISTNDLKSFKKYIENNYDEIKEDISTIKYSYSIDPLIYTIDATKKIAKINPNNLFSSMYNTNFFSAYSTFTSVFNQLIDEPSILNEQYDILMGKWPEEKNELVLILNEPNSISDMLVYSLGFRDTEKLPEMITKIMGGEKVDINNKPLTISYEEFMNKEMKLIMPTSIYKYNKTYDIYEDMSEDEAYMKNLYENGMSLKIVGIVCPKEGITTMALTSGVGYRSDLITYIIGESEKESVTKKQLENKLVDVLSGNKFDSKKSNVNFSLSDVISIDTNKLKNVFNVNIDPNKMNTDSSKYMDKINKSITTDINPSKEAFILAFDKLESELKGVNEGTIDERIENYLNSESTNNILEELENDYVVPVQTLKLTYSGLLKSLLSIPNYNDEIKNNFMNSALFIGTTEKMASVMTEAKMKKEIFTSVGELNSYLISSISNSFKIDEKSISDSFKLNLNEEELKRVINAMMNNNDTTYKTNLFKMGYQNLDEPTFISFYFNSFEGKEHFMSFIDQYNEKFGEEKEIKYTDTTGILMDSVKTIVNAVSYVLIAFVSISLVVSSIMIGIITYISVLERTKEIGILRAIGASKKNISSIFNAETFIIGLLSGLFGISITYILIPIINLIIHHFVGNIPLGAILPIKNALLLIILSIILTLIGGLIPAKSASKKDPVIALRTE